MEVNNQVLFVNPTTANLGANGIPGALTKFGSCAGCAGYTRANTRFGDFGPRFGIGYAFNDKTYFQAGVFMTYLQGGAYEFGTANAINMASLLAGSFNQSATGSTVPGFGDWDTRTLPSPSVTPFSPSLGIGNGVYYFNQNLGRAPYEQAWSANFQRELPWNQLLTISYVANHAVHLPSGLNPLNQPNPSILQYGSVLNDLVTSFQAAAAGISTPSLTSSAIMAAQSLSFRRCVHSRSIRVCKISTTTQGARRTSPSSHRYRNDLRMA